mmetsp:Transcript_85115/g.227542  ORF Transcript_85115/g.227542 Transcript_85115/m.227542 type:complete len:201 (+) Transcript_85115:53-655(+)
MIPMGGMGAGMTGEIPESEAKAFRILRWCVLAIWVSGMMRIFLGDMGQVMGMIAAGVSGILLIRGDTTTGQCYTCIMASPLQACSPDGGGLSCLMPFLFMNLMNAVFDILFKGSMIFSFAIPLVSLVMLTSVVASVVSTYTAWRMYKRLKGEGDGGGMFGGGGAPTQMQSLVRNSDDAAAPREADSSFVAFGGSGQRLGG